MPSLVSFRMFDFKGRINRLTYLGYSIALLVIAVIFAWAPLVLMGERSAGPILLVVLPLTYIVFFWMTFSLVVKRLHDLGMSGWVLLQVTIITAILAVVDHSQVWSGVVALAFNVLLFFKAGEAGANKYGEPPTAGNNFAAA